MIKSIVMKDVKRGAKKPSNRNKKKDDKSRKKHYEKSDKRGKYDIRQGKHPEHIHEKRNKEIK